MKTGILGGTFDPPHNGHILLARHAKEELNLDRIVLLPSAKPPHKKAQTMSKHRLEMTKLVAEEYGFEVCESEYRKKTPSYTFDAIDDLKKIYVGDKLFFIVGGDSMLDFETWYRWEELLTKCAFIVGVRTDEEIEAVKRLAEEKKQKYNAEIYILSSRAHKVSSTEIRAGKNTKEIPACLNEYIKQNSLYGD